MSDKMTFKPSEDVVEDMQNPIQNEWMVQSFSVWSENLWETVFHSAVSDENTDNASINTDNMVTNTDNEMIANLSNVEIVPSTVPDLSDLLKDDIVTESSDDIQKNSENAGEDVSASDNQESSFVFKSSDDENQNVTTETNSESSDEWDWTNKITDSDREKLVSQIDWSIHGKLDLLVDNKRYDTIRKYKIINRIVFRRGVFGLIIILGVILWLFFQVHAADKQVQWVVTESSIEEIWDDTTTSVLNSAQWIEVLVPYGAAEMKWQILSSKSNLIKYNGVILPQSISLRSWINLFSLQDFDNHQISRLELEDLLRFLISNGSILNFQVKSVQSLEWWLEQWFNLGCLDSKKVSNLVCNKFLNSFYEYWKYYNLISYDVELLDLTKKLKKQKKSVKPICEMVIDFAQHSWRHSTMLDSVMEYCDAEDSAYYRKLTNFIDVDQTLITMWDAVYSDADLNAYKLISFWQMLESKHNIDKGSIDKYLDYLEKLLDKDMWKNRYLEPLYKDLAYIYNMDYLYIPLQSNEKWSITSDEAKSLLLKLNQINNWNALWLAVWLKSQLYTPDILYTWFVVTDASVYQTAAELFSPYYSRVERLQIRKLEEISDEELKVQTEIYSMPILESTEWETLKATVYLKSHNKVLYVEKVTIAQYSEFSKLLNEYVSTDEISFNDLLIYIDQIVHLLVKDEEVEQVSLCDTFALEDEDVDSRVDLYACDESSLVLYKGDVEYTFMLNNWVLDDFTISDKSLEDWIKAQLKWVMTTKANTESIIQSIVNYEVWEAPNLEIVENEIQLLDQFRIHFGRVPEVEVIDWETEIFLVKFQLWEFDLQARYNISSHLLTRISYVVWEETLEIRWLTIELSAQNDQISSIVNNPRVFLSTSNPSARKKYQKMLSEE